MTSVILRTTLFLTDCARVAVETSASETSSQQQLQLAHRRPRMSQQASLTSDEYDASSAYNTDSIRQGETLICSVPFEATLLTCLRTIFTAAAPLFVTQNTFHVHDLTHILPVLKLADTFHLALSFSCIRASDAMQFIRKLTQPRHLEFTSSNHNNAVPRATIEQICQAAERCAATLESLTILDLYIDFRQINTDRDGLLCPMLEHLPNLRHVSFASDFSSSVDDFIVRSLIKGSKARDNGRAWLRSLNLTGCEHVSLDAIQSICAELVALEEFRFSLLNRDTSQVRSREQHGQPSTLEMVSNLRFLQHLEIRCGHFFGGWWPDGPNYNKIDSAEVSRHISALTQLRTLIIVGGLVQSANLAPIAMEAVARGLRDGMRLLEEFSFKIGALRPAVGQLGDYDLISGIAGVLSPSCMPNLRVANVRMLGAYRDLHVAFLRTFNPEFDDDFVREFALPPKLEALRYFPPSHKRLKQLFDRSESCSGLNEIRLEWVLSLSSSSSGLSSNTQSQAGAAEEDAENDWLGAALITRGWKIEDLRLQQDAIPRSTLLIQHAALLGRHLKRLHLISISPGDVTHQALRALLSSCLVLEVFNISEHSVFGQTDDNDDNEDDDSVDSDDNDVGKNPRIHNATFQKIAAVDSLREFIVHNFRSRRLSSESLMQALMPVRRLEVFNSGSCPGAPIGRMLREFLRVHPSLRLCEFTTAHFYSQDLDSLTPEGELEIRVLNEGALIKRLRNEFPCVIVNGV